MSIYRATQANEMDRCLKSLSEQSLPPNQIVLVRDGPVEVSVEQCIKDHSRHLQIYHLHFPHNRGLGLALRDGLQACDHEFVARVDSDDWSLPERFALQLDYLLNNPSVSVIGGWLKEYYQDTAGPVGVVRQTPMCRSSIDRVARRRNPLNHPTVMFRKSHALSCGNYKPCLLFEDYFLWARMLMLGYQLANLPQVLVETQVGPQYFSRRGGIAYVRNELNLLKHLKAIGFLSSIDASIFILSRIPVRLLPLNIRQRLYKLFLRKT